MAAQSQVHPPCTFGAFINKLLPLFFLSLLLIITLLLLLLLLPPSIMMIIIVPSVVDIVEILFDYIGHLCFLLVSGWSSSKLCTGQWRHASFYGRSNHNTPPTDLRVWVRFWTTVNSNIWSRMWKYGIFVVVFMRQMTLNIMTPWHGNVSALLTLCACGNPPSHKGPVMESFDVSFVVSPTNLLKKKRICQWFVRPYPCDFIVMNNVYCISST